jgi:hypothetical protein
MSNLSLAAVKNDGSNGHNAGNWEYRITDEHGNLWFDGGYSSEAQALAAGRKHLKKIGGK